MNRAIAIAVLCMVAVSASARTKTVAGYDVRLAVEVDGTARLDAEGSATREAIFADDAIRVTWSATATTLTLRLENVSDETLRIPWDETGYVGPSGVTERLLRSPDEFDPSVERKPSLVMKGASIVQTLEPASSYRWVHIPGYGLTADRTVLSLHALDPNLHPTKDKAEAKRRKNLPRQELRVRVLLPVSTQSWRREYLFTLDLIPVDREIPRK